MKTRLYPLAIAITCATLSWSLYGCGAPTDTSGDGSVSPSATTGSESSATSSDQTMAASSSSSTAQTSSTAASFSTSSASSQSSEASASSVAMTDFPHNPATQLVADSGSGYTDTSNWAPGICFPLSQTPDFADSQVYDPGGDHYPNHHPTAANPNPVSDQCDPTNYSYPWRDNFCEARDWVNPMCSGGTGHQGQDIRPTTCKANTYWAVAAEDGVITQIGSYTVAVTGSGSPHRIFRYLHMQLSSIQVKLGDHVVRGQKLGLVSNNLGISNGKQQYTTIHLHFEVRIAQTETLPDGTVLAANTFVPPYTSLVDAYQRKLAGDCPTVN